MAGQCKIVTLRRQDRTKPRWYDFDNAITWYYDDDAMFYYVIINALSRYCTAFLHFSFFWHSDSASGFFTKHRFVMLDRKESLGGRR